jgi:hypothetical protein
MVIAIEIRQFKIQVNTSWKIERGAFHFSTKVNKIRLGRGDDFRPGSVSCAQRQHFLVVSSIIQAKISS